jgi:hypothetical protein
VKTTAKRIAALLVAALPLSACADGFKPVSAPLSADSGVPLQSITVSGPSDIPLEPGEELPAEFYSAPLIQSQHVDVGFLPGIAWATASMRALSTHGQLLLRAKLKKGDQTVDADSALAYNEGLLPGSFLLTARVNMSVPADCGHRLDARAEYSAWMEFTLPLQGHTFKWGKVTETAFKLASQPACPPTVVSYSAGWISDAFGLLDFSESAMDAPDDYYFGDCEICQKWYAYIDDELIATWWECATTFDYFCDDIRA